MHTADRTETTGTFEVDVFCYRPAFYTMSSSLWTLLLASTSYMSFEAWRVLCTVHHNGKKLFQQCDAKIDNKNFEKSCVEFDPLLRMQCILQNTHEDRINDVSILKPNLNATLFFGAAWLILYVDSNCTPMRNTHHLSEFTLPNCRNQRMSHPCQVMRSTV